MNQNRKSITVVEKLINAAKIHKDLIELMQGFTTAVNVDIHEDDEQYKFRFTRSHVEYYDVKETGILPARASWTLNGTNIVILQSVGGTCNRINLTLQNLVSER